MAQPTEGNSLAAPVRPARSSARSRPTSQAPSADDSVTPSPTNSARPSISISGTPVSSTSSSYTMPEALRGIPSSNGSGLTWGSQTQPLALRRTSEPEQSSQTLPISEEPPRRLSENQIGKLPARVVTSETPPIASHWSPVITSPEAITLDTNLAARPPASQAVAGGPNPAQMTYSPDSAGDRLPVWSPVGPPPMQRQSSRTSTDRGASIPSRRSSLRRSSYHSDHGPLKVDVSAANTSSQPQTADMTASESASSFEMSALYASYAETPVSARSEQASLRSSVRDSILEDSPPTARTAKFFEGVHPVSAVPMGKNSSLDLMNEIDKAIGESADPDSDHLTPSLRSDVRQSMDLPVDAVTPSPLLEQGEMPGFGQVLHLEPASTDIAFSSPPNLSLALPPEASSSPSRNSGWDRTEGDSSSHRGSEEMSSSQYEDPQSEMDQSKPTTSAEPSSHGHEEVTALPEQLVGMSRQSSAKQYSTPVMDRSASLKSKSTVTHPNAVDLSRLVRNRPMPHACRWQDIPSLRSPGERAIAYAQRTNELLRDDTGLSSWVSFVRQRGRPGNLQPGPPRQPMSGRPESGGRSVSYAYSEAEFPMRGYSGGTTRAQDLSTSAAPPTPGSSLGIVPYPQLLSGGNTSNPHLPSISHSTSSSSIASLGGMHSQKSFLSSLSRRTSKRSNSRPVISNPTLIRSTSGAIPSGPRPLDTLDQQPMLSKRASLQTPLSNVMEGYSRPPSTISGSEVDSLSDILPHADRASLRDYLAKTGNEADAISAYMQDSAAGRV